MMGKVKIKGQDHIRLGQYQGLGWDRNKPREGWENLRSRVLEGKVKIKG